ncbi:G domain-containing protein [Durusdinium trenchii]
MLEQLRMEPHWDTCPICFEEQPDVQRLEHWSPKGDVSEHQMCGACRQQYGQTKCPFCKEELLKEELLDFIDAFLGTIGTEDGAYDAHEMSMVIEQWQFHEMEFEASPRVMRRMAQSLMENHAFQRDLRHALQSGAGHRGAVHRGSAWLWDAASLLFRLYGFHEAQPLQNGHLLEEAVEILLSPDEESGRLGLLYEQALQAWLLSGERPELASLVRRCGWAVVISYQSGDEAQRALLSEQILSTVHADYFMVSHRGIWGSKRQDMVWQSFCTDGPRDLV